MTRCGAVPIRVSGSGRRGCHWLQIVTQLGPGAQASTKAEPQAADPTTVPEAQAGTEAAPQAANQITANTPLLCGM
jgi:hypothetical protein